MAGRTIIHQPPSSLLQLWELSTCPNIRYTNILLSQGAALPPPPLAVLSNDISLYGHQDDRVPAGTQRLLTRYEPLGERRNKGRNSWSDPLLYVLGTKSGSPCMVISFWFFSQHLRHMSGHHREGKESAIGPCPTCPVWTWHYILNREAGHWHLCYSSSLYNTFSRCIVLFAALTRSPSCRPSLSRPAGRTLVASALSPLILMAHWLSVSSTRKYGLAISLFVPGLGTTELN